MIVGGDGYATHDDCDPASALGDLSGGDPDVCWICGEPVDDDPAPESDGVIELDILTGGSLLAGPPNIWGWPHG